MTGRPFSDELTPALVWISRKVRFRAKLQSGSYFRNGSGRDSQLLELTARLLTARLLTASCVASSCRSWLPGPGHLRVPVTVRFRVPVSGARIC
jgi:hypothetical protein